MSHDRHFGHLRSLLHAEPSRPAWHRICRIIERADADRAADQLIPYADTILDQRWPDHLRVAQVSWHKQALRALPRSWPLLRVLPSCAPRGVIASLDKQALLGHIRALDLRERVREEDLLATLCSSSLDLRRLDYAGPVIDGACFKPLWTRHHHIETLRIRPTKPRSSALDILGPLHRPHLATLDLERCTILPYSLRALLDSELPALRDVGLFVYEPGGFTPLPSTCRAISLRATSNAADVTHLLPTDAALDSLKLRGTLAPSALAHLHHIPSPASLLLEDSQLRDPDITRLLDSTFLDRCEEIMLRAALSSLTDRADPPAARLLQRLRAHTRSLGLSEVFEPSILKALADAPWPALTSLHISDCAMDALDPTRLFEALPSLETLRLWGVLGADKALEALIDALISAPCFNRLSELSLLNSRPLTSALPRLLHALDGHPRLAHLNLTNTSAINDHLCLLASKRLPALRVLHMGRCGATRADPLDALCAAPWLPQLTELRINPRRVDADTLLQRLVAHGANPDLALWVS